MTAKIIVLGSSASFPLPRTKSNCFDDYLDIENYQDKFILHDDPLCESAKKGGKDRRTRTSLALIVPRATILFDAEILPFRVVHSKIFTQTRKSVVTV